jgi:acyl-coenzyme A thioesterase PaaI-like protein
MEYHVEAHNTAFESDNRIHADDTARQYGFRGGLVPGVDVYAYLTHPAAMAWGLDWLERGTMSARFLKPVYDGRPVVVVSEPDTPGTELRTELHDDEGDLCASAEATMPHDAPPSTYLDDPPHAPPPAHRPPASASSLAPGTVLGSLDVGFRADKAVPYLADVREQCALYREAGVAHPGWLLRFANTILAANVELGPWIHVGSTAQHFAAVHDGDRVVTRGRVTDEYERKGHRFVELDVLLTCDQRPVARIHHTAIYEPRRTR